MRRTLDFLLYDWLEAAALSERERFAGHSRETFGEVLNTCERMAREKYTPFNRMVGQHEPQFDGELALAVQVLGAMATSATCRLSSIGATTV